MEEPRGCYADEAAVLLRQYNIVVRKWRTKATGCAYGGTNQIECPHPRNAYYLGILAHEIGHHYLGHTERGGPSRPRWKEELDAWLWSNATLEGIGVEPDHDKANASICHAFARAVRRGMRHIPDELRPYLDKSWIEWAEDWMQPRHYGIYVQGQADAIYVKAHNVGQARKLALREINGR